VTRAAPDHRPPSPPAARHARPAPRHARPPSSVRRQILTAVSTVLMLAFGIAAMPVLSLFVVPGAG
jgi:hypothetical protein